jgi:hypothetical protein
MKKILLTLSVFGLVFVGFNSTAFADGCYQCKRGGYVKYTGSDNAKARKAAKDKHDCQVNATRSSCNAANLKVHGTVTGSIETDESLKLAILEVTKK